MCCFLREEVSCEICTFLHVGPLIMAGQSVLNLLLLGADNCHKHPPIQNGEEGNPALLRSIRFTALRIKGINVSGGSGKQQERQILHHPWPCLCWPELWVTKVCRLFRHSPSSGICAKTENSEPSLPYRKMRGCISSRGVMESIAVQVFTDSFKYKTCKQV